MEPKELKDVLKVEVSVNFHKKRWHTPAVKSTKVLDWVSMPKGRQYHTLRSVEFSKRKAGEGF